MSSETNSPLPPTSPKDLDAALRLRLQALISQATPLQLLDLAYRMLELQPADEEQAWLTF